MRCEFEAQEQNALIKHHDRRTNARVLTEETAAKRIPQFPFVLENLAESIDLRVHGIVTRHI